MPQIPARPAHAGSARVQASKARHATPRRPPSHVRHQGAAVALEPTPVPPKDRLVRRARRPLLLPGARRALALRQEGDGPIQVLVESSSGHQAWRPLGRVLAPAQLRAWLRDGFGSSAPLGSRRPAPRPHV